MSEAAFAGEHLWAGQAGHAFVSLSFAAALLSFAAFWLSYRDTSWLKLARTAFNIHAAAVVGVIATLFVMLFNHFFEYQYVWQHSNSSMPMRYILSCFWEGQEGSFLLWTFWNVCLGLLLKRQLKGNAWEAPVMTVFGLVQVFLASMILGVYAGDLRIGSNPFLLLREHPDFMNMPFVKLPNYLAKLDGRGLNPLLMNYWMTIHPPTLFLGFASTLVPFSFAIAGLWRQDYSGWQKVALPWTFFGVLVLGTGILMGGAWAYEALSFGGFWAWDPVENASLVPWLVLVGGGHTMLVNRHKGGSLFTSHVLCIAAFLLVLYSTFLTRSGVLGNASVHAFTDLGMTGQLVLYVLTFVFLTVTLLVRGPLLRNSYVVGSLLMLAAALTYGYRRELLMAWVIASGAVAAFAYAKWFPKSNDEAPFLSREFWMFLGALVLFLAGMIITYFTSIPVINKLFGSDYAPPKVPVYNGWMLPFAVAVVLLMGGGQFLRYKRNGWRDFRRAVAYPFFAALLFGAACVVPLYFLKGVAVGGWWIAGYVALFAAALFGLFANGAYAISVLKGKIRKSGASVAHIGFALVLLGALISTSKKVTLSRNTSGRALSSLGADFDEKESILLTKGDTLPMGPYNVTYRGKRREGINVYFTVDYMDPAVPGKRLFTLTPRVQDNPRMGRAPEPDTRHYADRDIYTHVTYADMNTDTMPKGKDLYGTARNYVGHVGDTIFSSNAIIVIDSLRSNLSQAEYERNDSLLEITAALRCIDVKGKVFMAHPRFIIKNNIVIPAEDRVNALGLKLVFWKVNPADGSIEITVSERTDNARDFIVMKAFVFPFINVLWLGCLLMAVGSGIAVAERIRKLRAATS